MSKCTCVRAGGQCQWASGRMCVRKALTEKCDVLTSQHVTFFSQCFSLWHATFHTRNPEHMFNMSRTPDT